MTHPFCSACGRNDRRLARKEPPTCLKCYAARKQKKEVCSECGLLWFVSKRVDGLAVCRKCAWKAYSRPVGICSECGRETEIHARHEGKPICCACYRIMWRPERACSKCGKRKKVNAYENGEPVCASCYANLDRCSACGRLANVRKRNPDGSAICARCYRVESEECSRCGRMAPPHARENGKPVCMRCYQPPRSACSACGRMRQLKTSGEAGLCPACYAKMRCEQDPARRIKRRLRSRLSYAFRQFSAIGKLKRADEYGIDYGAIIEHLGPCPGKWGDWHIDHIVPLSEFDFNDTEQIRRAFAPGNHQWLTALQNLEKGNRIQENADVDPENR